MRVLVCGSRTWTDAQMVYTVLKGLYWSGNKDDGPWMTVIAGGARGADDHADAWAQANRGAVELLRFPANWDRYGKAAGLIRNQQMLDEGKPDLVVAFSEQPVTRGTADMVQRAKEAGVPVWVVSHG